MNIITYGTFDLLHVGHINLFRRARAMGNRLIVAVSTDEFNEKKGKHSIIPYRDRVKMVRAIRWVDEVIKEETWEQKGDDIIYYDAQMVMGDDWEGKFDQFSCIYLPRTEGISSTKIKSCISLI